MAQSALLASGFSDVQIQGSQIILNQLQSANTLAGEAGEAFIQFCRILGIEVNYKLSGFLSIPNARQFTISGLLQNDVMVIAFAAAAARAPKLERLDADGCRFGSTGAQAFSSLLPRLPLLTTLSLRCCALSDAACALILQHAISLTRLDLSHNDLGAGGAEAIGLWLRSATHAQVLVVDFNNFGPAGAQAIARGLLSCGTLTELYCGSAAVGDDGAARLGEVLQATQLRLVHLWRNDIGDTGAIALARGCSRAHSVTSLHLAQNRIGAAGLAGLAAHLSASGVCQLDLWGNGFADDAAQAVGELLSVQQFSCLKLGMSNLTGHKIQPVTQALRTSTVAELDLQDTSLGDEGGVHLVVALHHNTHLRTLCVAGCGLGPATAIALASCLRGVLSQIRVLDLSNNNLRDDGFTALAASLPHSTALHTLLADNTGCGDAACVAIGAAVPRCAALQVLSLCCNNMGTVGVTAILEMCKVARLTKLSVHNNAVNPALARALADECAARGMELSVDGIDPTQN
eukprot:TRINITY_DN11473_c0_g1_i1.p1 TRINITY_DN11473_c0_g1~~TRINITY_DN11473_c0_g1_i1.p1  ORF type:complete len:540 (+),score=93.82 TRINITY_DN11473_c0_g1_i1:71-1621(+)